jgi:hypothetical protein
MTDCDISNENMSDKMKVQEIASKAITDNDPKKWSQNYLSMMNKMR